MHACAKERVKLRRQGKWLQLYPATRPLDFVALDILGPFPKAKDGHEHVLIITDRYSNLTRACLCVQSQPKRWRRPSAIIGSLRTGFWSASCQIATSTLRPNTSRLFAKLWEFENCSQRPITHRRIETLNATTAKLWRPCGPMRPNIGRTGTVSPLLVGTKPNCIDQSASARCSLRLADLQCIWPCKTWPPLANPDYRLQRQQFLARLQGPHVGRQMEVFVSHRRATRPTSTRP